MTQSTNQPGAADLSKRTPEEIFAHHGQALGAEDLDATVMDFEWGIKTIHVDNLLFVEWTGDSARASVSDGVDTFIFKDGLIQAQTVHYTLVPKT